MPLVCENIPGYFPPPRGDAEIRRVFGDIKLVDGPSGILTISPGNWAANNCEVFRGLPGLDKPLYLNKKIAPMLRASLSMWQVVCPDYKIKRIGAFNARWKRRHDGAPSRHSWAIAIDINPDENPAQICNTAAEYARAKRNMPQKFVECFTSIGWDWGGAWDGAYKDFMHFQWCIEKP